MSEPIVEPSFSQHTVMSYAKSCLESFQKCLNDASKADKVNSSLDRKLSLVQVEDQLARFSLWTSNLRVFSSKRDSLDSRLRESLDVRDAIIGLLETLKYRVETCSRILNGVILQSAEKSIMEFPEEFSGALAELRDEISLLHRISNTIRRASKETQNVKAAQVFRIKDDEGNDAEPFLRQLFLNYVHDRFRGVSNAICQRLANSMLLRRKRILYRRNRYGKTAIRLPEVVAMPVISHPVQEPTGQTTQGPMKRRAVEAPARSSIQSTTRTATTLSPEKFRRAAVPSVISMSKTVALSNADELCFPSPPIARLQNKYNEAKKKIETQCREKHGFLLAYDYSLDEGDPSVFIQQVEAARLERDEALAEAWKDCVDAVAEVTCPYCFHVLPVHEVADEKKWKHHIKNDLDPYVCLFETCDSPEHLYTHSGAWRKHMKEHTLRWRCNAKSHDEFVSDTRHGYLDHMESSHTGKFTVAQLSVLADRNARPNGPIFQSCPLCGIETTDGPMEDHVVGHMRLLALKSLPTYQEDTDDIDTFEEHPGSINTSRPHSRSTIKNGLAGSPTHSSELYASDPDANSDSSGFITEKSRNYAEGSNLKDDPGSEEGPKVEKDEWQFMSRFRGIAINQWDDPILKSFRQFASQPESAFSKDLNKTGETFKFDPDCAICHAPASLACDCEGKALDVAVKQAETRMMLGVYNEIRRWVRDKAETYMRRNSTAEGSRISPGQASPQDMLESTDGEEKESGFGILEVLEYYFGLVELVLPGDHEPAVAEPPLGSLIRLKRIKDNSDSELEDGTEMEVAEEAV
ncbi:hypothetical protein F53441_5955 [Fusarium austroafricanum]|uniref:Oxidoreductase acuF-like C2H2 type zinc-finger domain-containing protein n=1 Tax=Fusarium austroafricanum TaxID=2364996 RepID=A0A8H4NZ54_9HYPO|nr:hypothetical protein F53441_5955 [Fusarium austroafricanum]